MTWHWSCKRNNIRLTLLFSMKVHDKQQDQKLVEIQRTRVNLVFLLKLFKWEERELRNLMRTRLKKCKDSHTIS